MFFEPYGIGAAVAGSFLFPVMHQKRNRCPFWFRFFVRWFRSRYSLRGFFSKNRFFLAIFIPDMVGSMCCQRCDYSGKMVFSC